MIDTIMPKRFLTLCLYVIFYGCSQNSIDHSNIILIDANKKYPILELKLSELADISYIALKTEGVIFGYSSAHRRLFVYRDKIFIGDRYMYDPKLVIYDRTGVPIQIIGSYGRGPGEYMNMNAFVVDTLTNEVTIYDNTQKKIIVYGIDGKFKREKNLEQINRGQKSFEGIEIINDNYLLAYNNRSISIHENDYYIDDSKQLGREGQIVRYGKPIMIIDKQTLTEVSYSNFEYAKPKIWDVRTINYNLTSSNDGVYITTERTDTIYFMNRNLEIIPKFRDITDYGSQHVARLFPAAETERYIFFSTEVGIKQGVVRVENTTPKRFFAYDKQLQKIFRLDNGLTEKRDWNKEQIAISNNRVVLDQYSLTLNHNFASTFFSPEFLLEHYNQLPEELKVITKNLKVDDNPVIMLIKFK